MQSKLYRWVFWPLWFVVIPLTVATLLVSALAAGDAAIPSDGLLGWLRWFAQDQKVPAIIVFFTAVEMVLYQLRHSLPFADRLGVSGRTGLPRSRRRAFEQAAHLLDDVHRTLRRHGAALERELGETARGEVESAMQALSDAMEATPFDVAVFDERLAEARRVREQRLAGWQRGELREYTESIVIAVGVALLLRTFLVEAFKIPSGSMLPTLQIQDHIFVNKFTYGPRVPVVGTRLLSQLPPARGDVVVFEYPDPDPKAARQDFIKRVVALPGDSFEVVDGQPIINGWPVPRCRAGYYSFGQETGYPQGGELYVEFLGGYSYLTLVEGRHALELDAEGRRRSPYRVGPGEFWVLGDNRDNSSDSRAWRQGLGAGVPFDNVKGRAMFVWLSFNNLGVDPLGVTWDRLFTPVLGEPRLPKEAPRDLDAAVRRCMSERPAVTLPPPAPEREATAAR